MAPADAGASRRDLPFRRTGAGKGCGWSRISRSVTAIVDTPEEAAALELPPLLVRRPLEAFLDERGSAAARSRPRRSATGTRTSPTWSAAATAPGCCAARRARRCRRPPTTCCARRGCCGASRHAGARRRGARHLRRRRGDRRPVLRDGADRRRRHHQRRPAALDDEAGRRRSARSSWTRSSRSTPSPGDACGLEGFGKPTGYLDRQLRRFSGLWEHNRTRELRRSTA